MIQVPGPLSFRLMIFSFVSFAAAFLLGPVFTPFGAIFGVGAIFLTVASITCGVYELMNNPSQKLFSMLSVSLSSTTILLCLIFIILGAAGSFKEKEASYENRKIYERAEYR